jgi:septum site-determining protein MinD
MGKIIIIASGKGGTGKTTTTANLGAALAMRGNLVALVDMDMGLRNLDVTLGLENSIVYDISDVVEDVCSLDEALIKDLRYENLYFIPAPQTRDASGLKDEAVKNIWEQLQSRFDYCIVDAPAGVDGGFLYAAMCADSAIIITMPELTALRDADRTISVLEEHDITDIKVVINRVRADMINRGIMMNMDDCIDILQIPVLGIIPDDEELMIASLKGYLAISDESSKAGKAFLNIAARLCGEEVPIMELEEKEGFFKKLKKRFAK